MLRNVKVDAYVLFFLIYLKRNQLINLRYLQMKCVGGQKNNMDRQGNMS